MKNLIPIAALILICILPAFPKDIIHLKNGDKIKGFITGLKENEVTIVTSMRKKDQPLVFTPEQVGLIEFDLRNVHIGKILKINADYTVLDGMDDAQLYHKRFVGNYALGFFFGIFGFIGVAVGKVKDPPGYIEDWVGKMKDGDYVIGYTKKGKNKNLGAAGLGWATWVAIVLISL